MLTMLVGCNNDKDETPMEDAGNGANEVIDDVDNGTNEVIDDVEKGTNEVIDDVTPGDDIEPSADTEELEKGTINTSPDGQVNEGTMNNGTNEHGVDVKDGAPAEETNKP